MKKQIDKSVLFKRIAAVVVALCIAGAAFGLGFLVKSCTQSKFISSYEWVLSKIKENYYYEVNEDDVYKAGLSNLSGNVLDAYSRYYTAEEYEVHLASTLGSQSGIGVTYDYVDASIGKGVLIGKVIGNSPAYKSGLRKGTIVTGANCGGVTVAFNSDSDFSSYVNARKMGETFTLITDKGDFEVAKDSYISSYCSMATKTKAWDVIYDDNGNMSVVEVSRNDLSFLPDGAAYLSFSQFYGNAANEMAELIARFNAEECKTLILDLRGNGGGSVDLLREIAWMFTGDRVGASETALTAKDKYGREEIGKVVKRFGKEYVVPADTQVYVLANCNSASASEALIGVLVSNGITPYENIYLSDYSEAEEYLSHSGNGAKNCRTYGKGIMQTTYKNYFTGEAVCLTTAVVYWPDGRTIHGVGLTPEDGCRTVKATWSVTYGDDELKAAVLDIASRISAG